MLKLRFASCIAVVAVLSTGTAAQNFPSKPIRILTSETGGGSDMVARLIAQDLSNSLRQPGIVDNRNGMIAAGLLAKAQPDGHTLLFFSSSVWIAPFLQDDLPYDPVKDFAPISLAMGSPNILVVHPAVPAGSVKELIALAKSKPGALNYARTVLGGSPQLAAELFKSMAGVNIVSIPYKGSGPGVLGLIGGEVQLMFPSAGAAVAHVNSGKLRALAVTSAQPSALVPGMPLLAATVPGYESASIIAVFAPERTPAGVINLLHAKIVRFLNTQEIKEKLFGAGLEVYGTAPRETAVRIKDDMARIGKVIKDAGIRAE
jgi:tripartite-type tricarboxylate transporter receptor subunit TctC